MENNFLISGLKRKDFLALDSLTAEELEEQHIKKQIVDRSPGFPCRITLREGTVGETIYLLNYQHLKKQSPYDAAGPIFVIAGTDEAALEINEIPAIIYNRFTSLRCYDSSGMMIEAYLYQPKTLTAKDICHILTNKNISFIHVHYAARGCYSARIDRV
ncbi:MULTISPECIES: DUF1203 domain-containing protein [unclassified Enterococcus]|uniref:DUF1203 domain-containing protein n=1 Tax=unclassified Enterococcus TaxID=2608891 RepID=UPI001CE1FDFF|nr:MULTISPECIES: DUF1203 domain-containing protein [unclassified Enterococcus]MCA5012373.1 DUF1203 domain-containing protein [Enterococcus sp. S23]MCA5015624.1 DUF1203 domain-containing protein [Enterococcus sp. S22(2020)]